MNIVTLPVLDGRLVIAGARADAAEAGTLALTDPSTGAPLAEVAAATVADVDHVTFTGSLPTGRRVMATAAEAMTPGWAR